ncbi:hypothetical protein ZOSMA_1437G00010, partial [Zostera marina]
MMENVVGTTNHFHWVRLENDLPKVLTKEPHLMFSNNEDHLKTSSGAPSSTPTIGKSIPSLEPQQEDMTSPQPVSSRLTPTNNENRVKRKGETTTQHVGSPKTPLDGHSPNAPNENGSSFQPHSPSSSPGQEENVESPSGSARETPTNEASFIGRSPNNNEDHLKTSSGAPSSTPTIGKSIPSLEPQQEDMASPQTGSPQPTPTNNEKRVKRKGQTTTQHVGSPNSPLDGHSPNAPNENGSSFLPHTPSSSPGQEESVESPSGSARETPTNEASFIGRSPNNNEDHLKTSSGAPSSTPKIGKSIPSLEPQQEDMTSPQTGSPRRTPTDNKNHVKRKGQTTTQHVRSPNSPLEGHSPNAPNENGSSFLPHSPSSSPGQEESVESPSGSARETPTNEASFIGRSSNNEDHLKTSSGAPSSTPTIGKSIPSLEPQQENMASPQTGSPLPTPTNNEKRVKRNGQTTTQHVGSPNSPLEGHSPNAPNENGSSFQPHSPSSSPGQEESVESPSGSARETPTNEASFIGKSPNNNEDHLKTSSGAPSSTPTIGKSIPSLEPQQEDM